VGAPAQGAVEGVAVGVGEAREDDARQAHVVVVGVRVRLDPAEPSVTVSRTVVAGPVGSQACSAQYVVTVPPE
jgi:hypothetical protein